ncbi:MAG: hypothetical protein M3N19_02145 [Candidatus Eremiobacteraeota bacterium]|nr:hypothetical protein [Candidatus Eremiobacteraeota bacterium]
MRKTSLIPEQFLALALVTSLLLMVAMPALAKVKSASTDGEATIYLTGDFAQSFDIRYAVALRPAPHNHAWTGVSLLLLGREWPGSSMSIGLSRGYPHADTLAVFTTSTHQGSKDVYDAVPVRCDGECVLELRGDPQSVSAILGSRTVRKWSRRSFPMLHPYIQINGEVSGMGDTIHASLRRLRATLIGKVLPEPICAFTTQGVEPHAIPGGFVIAGARMANGRVTYLSLLDGSTGDACPKQHAGKR